MQTSPSSPLKRQKTSDWTVSIVVKHDAECSDKPAVEDIAVGDTAGIDLGITKVVHDPENHTLR
jgi:hypothetical protein